MKEVKINMEQEEEMGMYFDPMSLDGITPRCVCGFELIKEDEDTFRCTGGNHRYRMSEGQIALDKFGNLQLVLPNSNENKKEKDKK